MSACTEVDDGRRGRRALAAAPPRARRAPRGLRGVPPRARGDGADARHARGAADGGSGVREPGGGHPAPRPAGRSRRGGGCARERLEDLAAAPGRCRARHTRRAGAALERMKRVAAIAVLVLALGARGARAQEWNGRPWQSLTPEEQRRAWENYQRYQQLPEERQKMLERRYQ